MQRLELSADQLLATTRSVRNRLDVTKPVPRAVIEACLETALQAPDGGNRNLWHWLIVDVPKNVAAVAAQYKGSLCRPERGHISPPRKWSSASIW